MPDKYGHFFGGAETETTLLGESLSDHGGPFNSAWTDQIEEKHKKQKKVGNDVEDSVQRLNYLWILISCGYMVSWTSIGKLRLHSF